MSGANTSYDPKQVAALAPEALRQGVLAAQQAFTDATDLDQLRAAQTAHLGDRSPLALANREIGALPPAAKSEAGKRINAARTEARQAYAERLAVLETERDERALIEESVDVTLPFDRRIAGARHPLTTTQELDGCAAGNDPTFRARAAVARLRARLGGPDGRQRGGDPLGVRSSCRPLLSDAVRAD